MQAINSAFSAILANKLRSFLTILGIVIGVMSVILLISLVSGLKTYITSQIEGLGSNLLFVIPGKIGGARSPGGVQANRLEHADANSLRAKLQDAEVSAAIQRNATVKYGSKIDRNVAVFGVESNYSQIIALKLTEGDFFVKGDQQAGRKVAVVGETVRTNLFGEGAALSKQIDVAGLRYTIIGTVGKRGSIFGIDLDNAIYIPFSAAQRQFGIEQLNTIYISVQDAKKVKEIQQKATDILGKRLSEEEFTVQSQEQALSTIGQITGVLTLALGGIAAISLLVGGIGIMNIMLVSVTERTREIGLRKAVGAKPSDIRNQFLIEAITLSGLGGVIGIMLGVLISFIIGRFFTTTVPLWSIFLSFGFSMLVGIIFGVAPALRASKLDPIEALRHE